MLFGSSRVDVRGSPGIEAARQPWREFSEETKRLDRKEIVKTCLLRSGNVHDLDSTFFCSISLTKVRTQMVSDR